MPATRFARISAGSLVQANHTSDTNYQFDKEDVVPHLQRAVRAARHALPAGTYAFEVVAPGSNDVVRVSRRDDGRVHLVAFTRRVDRPRGLRADQQIVFSEVHAGSRPQVKTWFPIGEAVGHEFIYPAAGTNQ